MTRVGIRLQEALHVKKPQKHRSEDLEAFTQDYDVLSKNLNNLISLLKKQHESMLTHNTFRLKVAEQLCIISKGTPISAIVGQAESTTKENENPEDENLPVGGEVKGITKGSEEDESFFTLYTSLATSTEEAVTMFSANVVDQVIAWEAAISSRIHNHQIQCEKLRREYEHYDAKTEGLHAKIAAKEAKDDPPSPRLSEKVERNDEKHALAKMDYEIYLHELCVYMEEVAVRAWKDLIPLILELAKLETKTASTQAGIVDKMSQLMEGLKAISKEYGFDGEQFRIHALKEDNATDLLSPEKKLASSSDDEFGTIATKSTTGLISPEKVTTERFTRKEIGASGPEDEE